jgi:capsular polysaccharide biosynthesis protein
MFQQFHPAVMAAIVIALIAAVVIIYKKANKKEYFDVDIPLPEDIKIISGKAKKQTR